MSNRTAWRDLTYLQRGSTRQRKAFEITRSLDILEKLAPFCPILVSTVCVGLDIEESDLDFICQFNAYKHLTVMSRLLKFGGEALRSRVRQLKRSGLKTEPALAEILGLSGDPYRVVLDLERASDFELQTLIQSTMMEETENV